MAVRRPHTQWKWASLKRLLIRTDYPTYELYTERLRAVKLGDWKRAIRLVVGRDRNVKEVKSSEALELLAAKANLKKS